MAELTQIIMAVGAVLIILGGYIMLNWYIFWKKNYDGKLLTHGPYSKVRHPYYSGFLIFVLGLSIALPYLELKLLAILSIFIIFWYIQQEEEALEKKFRRKYRDYKKKVKYRLIPNLY